MKRFAIVLWFMGKMMSWCKSN